MSVSGIGMTMSVAIQSAVDMRGTIDDLQRQFGTGKKSISYAGLGLGRGLTVGLRSQLSAIDGYQQTITQVGVRLSLMQASLAQYDSVTRAGKNTVVQSNFDLQGSSQTQSQLEARSQLDQALTLLNTAADGRYIFSGRAVDRPAAETVDHILNGEGGRAGLIQVTAERRLADLGASGLGRLTIGAPDTDEVSLTEDAVSPFGFKISGVTSNLTGATVTGPAGSPATFSVEFSPPLPSEGQTLNITFDLPDGTSADLTLTATASSPPQPGQFTIGADADATATNFSAALNQGLTRLAATKLAAASAVAAGNDFFNTDAANPPQRVAGPPFESATALVDGTDANTVGWYLGDDSVGDPRATAVARADHSLSVSYGARANEQALRRTVQNLAVFAAATYSELNPNDAGRFSALQERVGAALIGPPRRTADHRHSRRDRRRAGCAEILRRPAPADRERIGQPPAKCRGHPDRRGRGQDPGPADEPAGHLADHGAAAAYDAPELHLIARCPAAKQDAPRPSRGAFQFGQPSGSQARPRRPAASSRLIWISGASFSGFGSKLVSSL
ncbi:MAG: flagellar biosynthesis protein FlgL [Alphaproteobacteria bacterium]|nr:flagellar biosynthesis protein FlgL [Alphaproteobacteria bacterium]